ncbi:Small nucleolar ribonucleoprotein complex subunit [Lasiodiplodia theobromae]|uniref:U3 small nucleolar RNA-associated protein 18 n=1 Tax=Lasiodiplodia theobromae TaxID=45133 RepID=A0A5N5DQ26_9PEZI|nr:Small nucleolar ribonucleoprotein complex subunit [Lasiodiplodia theobromae]KAB2580056.1 U3 small nucleolar RNA-associated protein 18 [Lasiodiplodia theobromae]KAF4540942.1 Small nucleolar ribonucleoprotein complex subunit [Lasiodiplodia theobromae]
MAPVSVLERSEEHAPFQLPADFARYASDSDASASDDDVDMQKDATEEELERLVFGDRTGFRDGVKNFGRQGELVVADEEEEGSDLDNVADADLFFVDAGPDAAAKALVPAPGAEDSDDDFADAGRDAPAWEDSDDERMVVSLASVPRLRKLRKTEDEDLINGKEYARRLRRQFERLYPTPDWAVPATRRPSRKRRKISEDAGSSAEEDASSDEDMDIDDDDLSAQPLAKLLKDADSLTRRDTTGVGKKRRLRAEVLDIQRTKDISGIQPSAITSLSFHPTLPLLLSSGPSSTLYLHHVQPVPPNPNPLLTSLHIKRTPLTTTAFHPSPDDSRIFLSARRRYFHVWNLAAGTIEKVTRVYGHQQEQRTMERFALSPNGRYMALLGSARKGGGYINILDARTLQWQSQARIESRGGIADFAWWADGNGLTIAGKNGEVSEWDVVAQRLRARWVDEGAIGTSVVALGGRSGRDDWLGGDRWVAVGSSSGIVNIYDRRAWLPTAGNKPSNDDSNGGVPAAPKPVKVLDQLTTPISHLRFSPDGQLLAMASRWKKDALRLVHLPSCTVYRNWPTNATPLGRITAVAFGDATAISAAAEEKEGRSVDAELLLAVANEQGKIRMWEIRA